MMTVQQKPTAFFVPTHLRSEGTEKKRKTAGRNVDCTVVERGGMDRVLEVRPATTDRWQFKLFFFLYLRTRLAKIVVECFTITDFDCHMKLASEHTSSSMVHCWTWATASHSEPRQRPHESISNISTGNGAFKWPLPFMAGNKMDAL